MLLHHHANRVHHRTEHRRGSRLTREYALFHERYVGKEHLLFFHQVNPQFLGERGEDLLHLEELRMILAVHPDHLGGERQNARTFFANESVVRGCYMTDQVRQ